jgi:acyl-coenzyme A synthetase/AMP-(fatty) acid ligase
MNAAFMSSQQHESGIHALRSGARGTGVACVRFYKAPRGVTFVSELPKTATGKIQKYVLRKGAPNLSRQ